MISLKNALEKILNPDILLMSNYDSNNQRLCIPEDDPSSAIKKVFINGLKNDFIAFTLDYKKNTKKRLPQLSQYLNKKEKFINRSSDFVIFVYHQKKWFVIIGEIKSNNFKMSKAKHQLCNSHFFLNFIIDLLGYHFDLKQFFEFKTVIISNLSRKRTVYRPNQKNTMVNPPVVNGICNGKAVYVHINDLLNCRTSRCT